MITDANRRRWVLVAMTGGLSMILLDTTVVTVALPSIQDDLDLSQTELQWVVNAYLLSLAALVPLAGRLADVFDRVRVFNVGVVVFAVSSATCALAVDEWSLIISRAAEGVGPHGTSGRRTPALVHDLLVDVAAWRLWAPHVASVTPGHGRVTAGWRARARARISLAVRHQGARHRGHAGRRHAMGEPRARSHAARRTVGATRGGRLPGGVRGTGGGAVRRPSDAYRASPHGFRAVATAHAARPPGGIRGAAEDAKRPEGVGAPPPPSAPIGSVLARPRPLR